MAELALTFLGTGTSAGVPVIGCDCRVCVSEDARNKRLRTAAYLETPEACWVIDTPPDFRTQCLRQGIRRVDAVLYTHSHSDHILGFDDLRRFCEMEDRGMPIYAKPATMAALRRIYWYVFNAEHYVRTYVRPEPVEIDGTFDLAHTRVVPVDLPHGSMICTGYVFWRQGRKLLAYYTDCHAVPEEALEAARGAEVLVLDALRWRLHTTHLSIESALEVAAKIGARRTFFVHMCHEVEHAETQARLPDGVMLAWDTLRVEIG